MVKAGKPNVLLIMTDQHRYDCIGYSGVYPIQTPNIDGLAREGSWFSSAFTPIPLCCPARQALLNGRRPETFGALWNYDLGPKIPALHPDQYSWPRHLRDCGYATSYIGKWHVNPEHDPTEYGFNNFVGTEPYEDFQRSNYPNIAYTGDWFGERDPIPLNGSQTHWLADKAVEAIETHSRSDQTWHVRLDFPEPHLPCRPADPYAQLYNPEEVPPWESFEEHFENKPYIQRQQLYNWRIEDFDWKDWAPIVARYYGVISQVDDAVGKVLAALDHTGQAENTLVIYTSDHGDMSGGHRMMDKHYVLYDDVVHVPLIIRWPAGMSGGTPRHEFVYNLLDLPPTILELAGLEPPTFLQGRSLVPLLIGETVTDWRQEVVSTYNGQQFGLYTQRMLRDRRYKYVWNATDVDELYDIVQDPGELTNLAGYKGLENVLGRMRRQLYSILIQEGDDLVANPWLRGQLLNSRKLVER